MKGRLLLAFFLPVAPSYLVTLKEKHFTAPAMVTWSPVPLRQRQKGPQAAGSRGEATHLPRPACDARYSTEWPNLTASGGAAGPPTPPLAEGFGLPALAMLESGPSGSPPARLSHRQLRHHVHGSLEGSRCQGARPASCSKCPHRAGHTRTHSRICVNGESI